MTGYQCGPCAIGAHDRCTGLLKTSYGFCSCADHGHGRPLDMNATNLRRHSLELRGIADDLATEAGVATGFLKGQPAIAEATIAVLLVQLRKWVALIEEDCHEQTPTT